MSDENSETRKNALAAYAFVFKFTPEFQQKLTTKFESEDISNRMAIAVALIMDGDFSAPVVELLFRLLDDPKYDHIIGNELANKSVAPPTVLLPKLAAKLADAKEPGRKQAFARAIKKYGAQATPYLNLLEQLREKEADDTTNLHLKAAIEAIQPSSQSPAPSR